MKRNSVESKEPNTLEDVCPECFKVVGSETRYKIACFLGKAKEGATVSAITIEMGLSQPTVTHHLNVLRSVGAVAYEDRGRSRTYRVVADAHCFEECKIPLI